MKGGVYAYRTLKPGARFRIPILSWHWGYVGETRSFYHRHLQHSVGGGAYRVEPKDWADRSPRCYRLALPDWRWLRRSVESLAIGLLWPVYNVQKNRWNPRRIPPKVARWQRHQRDIGAHWLINIRPVHTVLFIVLACLVWALIAKVGT